MTAKKKSIKERTQAIRDECDNIDNDVDDKNAETAGDPVVKLY